MQWYGPGHGGEIIEKDDQVLVLVVLVSWEGLNVRVNKLKGVLCAHGCRREGALRLFAFSATWTDLRFGWNREIRKSGCMLLCLFGNFF